MNLLFLLPLLAAADLAVAPCGGSMTIDKVTVTPVVPVAGQPITLHLEYRVPTVVTGGTSETSITYSFIPLAPTVEPLCSNVPCPLEPGAYKNDTVTTWPSGVSGNVAITTKWFDPANLLLLCFKLTSKAAKAMYTTAVKAVPANATNISKAVAIVQKKRRACRNKTACFRAPR